MIEWFDGKQRVTYIGATDTSNFDLNEDVSAGLELWDWTVLEGHFMGLLEHEGEVLRGERVSI